MKGRDVVRRIEQLGGEQVRQRGSHVRMRAGNCFTTVPVHRGQDLPRGTLAAIQRDLAPELGERWLTEGTTR